MVLKARPKKHSLRAAIAVMLISVSCSAANVAIAKPPAEPGDPARGRAFVKAHCSSCHAIGRTGRSPYRPAPPFRTLNAKHDVEGLAEAFAEGIIVGHKGEKQMPEFVLQPDEIDDLIAYLRSLNPHPRHKHSR